jgi:hypothetical protein
MRRGYSNKGEGIVVAASAVDGELQTLNLNLKP